MEQKYPVYSEETRCQDCYKCIRECPVKAIRVVDGEAELMPDHCILCGHCVAVCPVGAKRVRDDLRRAMHLIQRKRIVILSLAPSFAGEFASVPAAKLIAAIKKLGFHGVSETALGAQEVSAFVKGQITGTAGGILLSSACPSAVDLIVKYYPEFTECITGVYSPLLAHCVLLRKMYGDDIGIVFAGPCIAKKKEADVHPELLDLAITFEDLRKWFDMGNIDPASIEFSSTDVFIPETARNGALYPIEGGMLQTLKCDNDTTRYMTLSGVDTIQGALRTLAHTDGNEHKLFIELLACKNGCIKGPKATSTTPVGSRMAILDYSATTDQSRLLVQDGIQYEYSKNRICQMRLTQTELQTALEQIGKFTKEEELNCGSCGYGTCRDFAVALIENKAEACMCISYMRKLAQKKANALIKTIPYGVVIVDKHLKIIESNAHFATLFGSDVEEIEKVIPGLKNADLSKIVPFHQLFTKVILTGEEITQQFVRYEDRVIAVTIFTVEEAKIAGAILRDATMTESKREQIIEKAQEVIRNTSVTAQQIAFLMGKNAAQSEKILTSLIDSFSVKEQTDLIEEGSL
jgi:iron only hydrogenase large subunit-like protein